MHDGYPVAGFVHLVLVIRPGGPDFAVQLDLALVGADPVQDQRVLALQRLGRLGQALTGHQPSAQRWTYQNQQQNRDHQKTTPSAHTGRPSSQLEPAAANAPPLSMIRNMSPVSASAPARPRAKISQISAAGIVPRYPQRPGAASADRKGPQQLHFRAVCGARASRYRWGQRLAGRTRRARRRPDALTAWAPAHSVIAYDAVAAGRTGLPWPDVDAAGSMSLLQTMRTAAARTVTGAGRRARRSASPCRFPATFGGWSPARNSRPTPSRQVRPSW